MLPLLEGTFQKQNSSGNRREIGGKEFEFCTSKAVTWISHFSLRASHHRNLDFDVSGGQTGTATEITPSTSVFSKHSRRCASVSINNI